MGNALVQLATDRPSAGVPPLVSNPSVWYPLHEAAGTTLSDNFSLGPTLTVGGTSPAATIWANAGVLTPNGTDHVATAAAASAHMDSICRWTDLWTDRKAIHVGIELQLAAASSSLQYFFTWGRDVSTAGFGSWGLGVNTTDQAAIVYRAVGAGANVSSGLGTTIPDAQTSLTSLLFSLYFHDPVTLRVEVRLSSNPGVFGNVFDLTGLTLPSAATDPFALMGRRTAAATYANLLGSGASGARIDNFFIQKRPYSAFVADDAFADMLANRREFPLSLRG